MERVGFLGLLVLALAAAASGQVIYRQDFEGLAEGQPLAHWTTTAGQWSVGQAGSGVFQQTRDDLRGQAFAAISWSNYLVRADLCCTEPGPTWGMGLIAYWQDEANYYRLASFDHTLQLLKIRNGIVIPLATCPLDFEPRQWYVFQFHVANVGQPAGQVRLYGKAWPREAAEPANWQVSAWDLGDILTHGPAGFWTGQAAVQFDHFRLSFQDEPTNGEEAYQEDFEAPLPQRVPYGWLPIRGEWRVAAGEKSRVFAQQQNQPDLDFNSNAYAVDRGWADYTVQARLRCRRGRGAWGMGLVGYWQNENNNYRLHSFANSLFLARRSGPDGRATHLQQVSFQFEEGTWYVFKFRLQTEGRATHLAGKVWREGEREPADWLLEAQDESRERFTAGPVGFWCLEAACQFDDLVVTPER